MNLNKYLNELVEAGCTPEYIGKMRACVTKYSGGGQEALSLLGDRVSQATVDDILNRLRTFGRWLEREGLENPHKELKRVRASKGGRDRAVFTASEVRRLTRSEAVSERRRVLWGVLAWTGLRPVEASRVRPEHIVRVGERWELRLPAECQKSRRPDVIELDNEEAEGLKKFAPLVTICVSKLGRWLESDMRASGVPVTQGGVKKTPYDLRSFFVAELFRQGLDPQTVRALARHSRVETTLIHYTRFRSSEAGAARKRAKAQSLKTEK